MTGNTKATALGAAHTPGQVGRLQRFQSEPWKKDQKKKKTSLTPDKEYQWIPACGEVKLKRPSPILTNRRWEQRCAYAGTQEHKRNETRHDGYKKRSFGKKTKTTSLELSFKEKAGMSLLGGDDCERQRFYVFLCGPYVDRRPVHGPEKDWVIENRWME